MTCNGTCFSELFGLQIFDSAIGSGQHNNMTSSAQDFPARRVESGGNIPGTNRPAFTLEGPRESQVPILLAVPHAGRDYPSSLLAQMRDPDFTCLRLEDRLVDEIAREVARLSGALLISAHAPRAMLDLNRARDDVDWDMVKGQRPHPVRHSQANRRARSGLGLVPRRLPGFGEIWRTQLDRKDLDQRIGSIHQPYHEAIARELARIRDIWGCALLIDMHSMPPLRQTASQPDPPQFVIGDRFGASCDAGLVAHAYRNIESNGRVVAHNRPYAGGFVLETHGQPRRGFHAMQLEICRSAYLDGRLAEVTPRAQQMARMLADWVRELSRATQLLSRDGELPEAAE